MAPTTQPIQLPEALKTMLELQDLDTQLGKWEKQRLALQKQVDESLKELKASQARQDEQKKASEGEKKKRGLLELDVKVKEDEIKKHNAQLSQLTSNDQYKAKLSEIQNARKEIASIEEVILGLIQNEEAIKAKFDEEAKVLAEQTEAAQAKQAQMAAEAKGFEELVLAEQGKRESLLEHMGPDFAAIYARFHKANKGKVITRVEHERCSNCRMKISAHQINEVRKLKNICYCQSCGLILAYAEVPAV
jgi:predicted  nucleic acid-binding Zn-ribbon protein